MITKEEKKVLTASFLTALFMVSLGVYLDGDEGTASTGRLILEFVILVMALWSLIYAATLFYDYLRKKLKRDR